MIILGFYIASWDWSNYDPLHLWEFEMCLAWCSTDFVEFDVGIVYFLCLAALRAKFLIECLADLKTNLMKRGLNLLIQQGKPEQILPSLAIAYGVHTVNKPKLV